MHWPETHEVCCVCQIRFMIMFPWWIYVSILFLLLSVLIVLYLKSFMPIFSWYLRNSWISSLVLYFFPHISQDFPAGPPPYIYFLLAVFKLLTSIPFHCHTLAQDLHHSHTVCLVDSLVVSKCTKESCGWYWVVQILDVTQVVFWFLGKEGGINNARDLCCNDQFPSDQSPSSNCSLSCHCQDFWEDDMLTY